MDECCTYCHRPFRVPIWHQGKYILLARHKDHFIPKSKGGSDEETNRVVCCHVCNGVKHNKVFETISDVQIYMHAFWQSPIFYDRINNLGGEAFLEGLKVANAKLTFEQRSAAGKIGGAIGGKKQWIGLSKEERSAMMAPRGQASMSKLTPEQRSARGRFVAASLTPEQRSTNMKKVQANRSKAERQQNSIVGRTKALEALRKLTPEQRSAIGRKAAAASGSKGGIASSVKLSPEQRSERARIGGLAGGHAGGLARAAKLTHEQMSEIGRKAGKAGCVPANHQRWHVKRGILSANCQLCIRDSITTAETGQQLMLFEQALGALGIDIKETA